MKCTITRSNGQSSEIYKEKPEFFYRNLELFVSDADGPSYDIVSQGVTDDDRVELPFEFTWPERTELPPGPKWLPHPYFEHFEGTRLPTTYTRITSTRMAGNRQLVEYFLEARLFTSRKDYRSQEVRCPLTYRPYQHVPNPIPPLRTASSLISSQGITAQTHRLHPEYDPNEGFRARVKASWHKDKAPYAKFKVDVSCPSVVVSGLPVTLTFHLDHVERSKEIPDPPPVYLRHISVSISTKLEVRIPSRSLLGSRDMRYTYTDKWILLDKSFDAGEELLLFDGATAPTAKFPLHLEPAFRTFGLALNHVLKVELWGECAREKFRFIPVQGPIMIVERSNLQVNSVLPPAPPPKHDTDVPPPPYQVLDKN